MSNSTSSVGVAWFTELLAKHPGAAEFRANFDGLVDELMAANQQASEDVALLREMKDQLEKSTNEINRLKAKYETGEHPLAWFDRLTAKYPGAESFRKDLDNLVSLGSQINRDLYERATKAETLAENVRADLEGQDRLRKYLIELTVSVFDKASAYTTLLVSLGFVGLFSAWSHLQADLSLSSNRLVGISSVIALAVFVGFEIYKMFIGHRLTQTLISTAASQGAEFDEQVFKFMSVKDKMQGGHQKAFYACLAVSTFFGLGAASILTWACLERFFL